MNGSLAAWRLLPVWFRGLIRAMRPKQWAKNGFVFIPILFDRQITHLEPLTRVTVGFLLFCLTASAVYLMNDIVDVERDRLHPKKRFRPIASGELPVRLAAVMAVVLPILSVIIAWLYSPLFALVLIAYIVKQVAYSFYLKNVVIVDVLLLAAGYILRVIGGVVLITVTNFSPWLYVCVGMAALFLAVGKRRQELILLGNGAQDVRATYKQYNLALLDEMLRITVTSSVITYTLYTVEAKTNLRRPRHAANSAVYHLRRFPLPIPHVRQRGRRRARRGAVQGQAAAGRDYPVFRDSGYYHLCCAAFRIVNAPAYLIAEHESSRNLILMGNGRLTGCPYENPMRWYSL